MPGEGQGRLRTSRCRGPLEELRGVNDEIDGGAYRPAIPASVRYHRMCPKVASLSGCDGTCHPWRKKSSARQDRNAGSPRTGGPMQLDLSDDDAELLRDVLDSVVRDLSPEIADTDNPYYRRELKERRDRLRGVLDVLGGPLGAQLHIQAR